ncbi:terminase family protein [Pasteurella multocida]|uniref:terminase large subunit domain-containing protein n=1 Tax=Pasteurella multocida TaxID=747 RepID=UPI000353EFF4|nr:terminase family protein [Pasteurella multocida]ESQ72130.1 oxidoreductase [Pasteurella multocida subsp. multocida P1062]MCL7842852.1 terminase family protein [Pasteurella multocida]MDX3898148.1 terminase family protein [Pasteurella multocida]MDX3950434.1 terminase family protein [Pasteurella multocida]MDX3980203.1 terminase family protein [Pasteurella multocida]
MQEQEENIEIIVKPEIDLKRKAQVMYFGGYKISEISRQLDIPVSTISSWKERDKWDDIAPVGRVELALESRMILLIAKEQKSGADFKEIDLLGRQMEKVARVKKYSFGEGNETDLNPKIKNRNSGPRKTGDKNPISEEQQELLINGFLEGMFNYQRLWFDAGKQHRIRNILKSRQIGATYYFAHEALVDALVTGRNQIFLSASKKQALQFRSYITAYARKTADVELKGETILLPNGAELIFLGTNSATAQSYHGNLYFDEIFWVPKFAEMRKVAAAMASQKQYRQTYFSTPTTIASDAYQFWSGKSFNKRRPKDERIEIDISHENLRTGKLCADRQWKQIVNIYDAEAGGCNLFDIDDLIAENSREEFEQLYMCQFADDTSSVFKFNELQLCQVDSLEDWKDYKPFFKRPFGNREVWLGYDPSHTGDRAALVIVAPPRVEGGDYRILHYQTFHGLDFEAQAKQIQRYTEDYNVTKITIDKTGLGAGVYQEVKKFYRTSIGLIGLDYNVDLKNEMVLKTLNLIQKRRLKFDGKEVISSFMTVKKRLTRSGRQMTYVSDRSEEASHGDICWATMNCVLNIPFGENLNHHKNGSTIFTFN